MNKKSFALFYRAHTLIGLFVSVHCLVLFATGAILIFKDEIQNLLEGSRAAVSESEPLRGTPRTDLYDFILQQALQEHPTDRPLSLFPDEEDPSTLNLRMGIDGSQQFRGARRLSFDAVTGLAKESKHSQNGFFAWVLELHRDIFLGSWGKLYVGLVGLLYLFTLISGFFIYGNFMKKRAYGEIQATSARGFYSEIHRFAGVSILAWSLLMGFTGMLLAFNSSLIKIYQYSELGKLTAQYQSTNGSAFDSPSVPLGLANLDQVIATAKAAQPDAKVSFVAFPDTQFSIPHHFIVLIKEGGEGFSQNLSRLAIINAHNAELVEVRTLPLYLKMLMLSEPLHFGNYGGVFLKWIWLLFALVSFVLPISGMLIFVKRKWRARSDSASSETTATKAERKLFFKFTKNPYVWPSFMILTSAAAMGIPLLTMGQMPWVASLICAGPALVVAIILFSKIRSPGSSQ